MTVAQIIFDALAWCRYFAANESIGRPEVKLIFYEAFQTIYAEAVISNPEFFSKSMAYSGTTITLPADFRMEQVLVVNDAGCTSGYAKVIDNSEWSVRQSNSRLKGTPADPLARKDTSIFTISNSVTDGTMYYLRNYAETDLTTESTEVTTLLPTPFEPVLLSEMQRLIRVRHFKMSDTPTETERRMALNRASAKLMKAKLTPLNIVEGNLAEKPQSV